MTMADWIREQTAKSREKRERELQETARRLRQEAYTLGYADARAGKPSQFPDDDVASFFLNTSARWGTRHLRIYTRSGDEGETGLLFGGRVSKSDIRAEAYGSTDHAVSAIGLARAMSVEDRVKDALLDVQREMFMIGAELATHTENRAILLERFQIVTQDHVARLESLIDEIGEQVELPPNFIIPGASSGSAALDVARTQVRTAERRVVELREAGLLPNVHVLIYLNRLSDLLFMLARYEDRHLPFEIVTGEPPQQ